MKKHISINTSKHQQKVLSVAIVSMFLSACGGGGGSNGTVPTTPTTPPPFTSWSAVTNGSTVVVPGMSQEVSWARNPVTGLITSISAPTAVDTVASSFEETLNSGSMTKLIITSPTGSVTFDTAAGATIGPVNSTINVAENISAGTLALAADPVASGWNYQSFGVWETTGRVTGSGNVGVMSIGAPTAGTAIPTIGTATYTGKSVGFYTDVTGQGHATFSNLRVDADFALRTLALNSTGTVATTPAITNPSILNFTGQLTYAAGTNSFAGNVATTGGTLSGTSSGRFYGPGAQELGGVFILQAGSGVETYGGAYGAKR